MRAAPSISGAAALLAVVVIAWGINWPVTKLIVEQMPPIWTTAIRCWIALAALLVILPLTGNLIVPHRADLPIVLSVALLHMTLFSTLVAAGLKFLPASRAIVLGYTTPLWVAVLAPIFIGERLSAVRGVGLLLGMLGLGLILNPWSLDWSDENVLLGCGMILLAGACWAASLVHVRWHQWIATPLQLVLWQILVAAILLTVAASAIEGRPQVVWSGRLAGLLLYGGLVGTALAYWAMSMVNKSLPALTTSLGLTATPVVGIASAAFFLGETVDFTLLASAVLVLGGIAVSTFADARGLKHETE